jgi:hypothetical protein
MRGSLGSMCGPPPKISVAPFWSPRIRVQTLALVARACHRGLLDRTRFAEIVAREPHGS